MKIEQYQINNFETVEELGEYILYPALAFERLSKCIKIENEQGERIPITSIRELFIPESFQDKGNYCITVWFDEAYLGYHNIKDFFSHDPRAHHFSSKAVRLYFDLPKET